MVDTARVPAPGPELPRYEFRLLPLARFGLDLVLGWRRSLEQDSFLAMSMNPYPRRFEGVEHVPASGSFILVMNHHNREGLRPYHCAMAVTSALAGRRRGQPEVRWAFTSELYGRRLGPVPIPLPLIRWVFRRIALVHNLVVMPRREELVMGRAAALRRLAGALASAPVALAPEAAGSGQLIEPPYGTGLFLASLSGRGYPILPVAVWEEGDTLVVRFGEPFRLRVPRELPRDEQDRLAREQVMVAIGRHLPRERWGAYQAAIERELAAGRG